MQKQGPKTFYRCKLFQMVLDDMKLLYEIV